jgi:hypothetical protein
MSLFVRVWRGAQDHMKNKQMNENFPDRYATILLKQHTCIIFRVKVMFVPFLISMSDTTPAT